MSAPDRDSTQDWLIPEMRAEAGSSAPPPEADFPAPGPASQPGGSKLADQIAAVAASVDAAGDLAEAAAGEAARAHQVAEQGSQRAGQALERVEAVEGRLDQTLAALEAAERAQVHRAAETDPDPLRRFEARADRVAQRLRDLERRRSPHRSAGRRR